ncbi:hypothetical protein HDU86_005663 [Geranomyces michiganensis]|nr:hypothetical protein HDU86_005663 [Geranomyces michiganensis]
MVATPPPIASGRHQTRTPTHPPTSSSNSGTRPQPQQQQQHQQHHQQQPQSSPQRHQSSSPNPATSQGSSGRSGSGSGSGGSRRPHGLFGPYKLSRTLGEGEFGKVKLATHTETGKQVAIKLIKKENIEQPSRRAKLMREISLLQAVDHPFIVTVYEVIETRDYIGMIMEYASGGELFEHILAHRYLKERDACRFFAQLLAGVAYLHGRQIVHRDLKLENLLLDGQRNVIITDFGFANRSSINPEQLLLTSCGSPCYAAPELVISDGYVGEAADIWSCGVILYAMLCGYLPFDDDPNNPDGDNINLLYKYILETELDFPDYVGADARELLKRMLVPDPRYRANMKEIMNHRWLEPFRSFYQEEEKKLFGTADRSKTPNATATGVLYDTPPATPPSGLRVPEIEMDVEDVMPPADEMQADSLTHKAAGINAVIAADDATVPIVPDVPIIPITAPMPATLPAPLSDAMAVIPLSPDDTLSPHSPMDGDVYRTPDTSLDISEAAAPPMRKDLPPVIDSQQRQSGSSSDETIIREASVHSSDPPVPKDPLFAYGVPTSVSTAVTVSHPATVSTPNLVRAHSHRERKNSAETRVMFQSSVDLTAKTETGETSPVSDTPVAPPRRIDYGRKSFDVRRTESSSSRKSIFGWMKKSGYPPSPSVHALPPTEDAEGVGRPHSSVDTDRTPTPPGAPPRMSVHAPSVMSTASEWTIVPGHGGGPGQKVKLRYHSGPIDQRALSSKAPSAILADVRAVLQDMGMIIVGGEGFKMRVVRSAAIAMQQRYEQQQAHRQQMLEQQTVQQEPPTSTNNGGPPHRRERQSSNAASDYSFNMTALQPPTHAPHAPATGGPPPVAFERRSIAHVLASFPVSLVKKLKNVARYGSGYNRGFGKADAAAIYSHHHGGSTTTLGGGHHHNGHHGGGYSPYYSHANTSTASRESFATNHTGNGPSHPYRGGSNASHVTIPHATLTPQQGFYAHGNNSSVMSHQLPPLVEGEIRFTVEVQRIKNLPGLFVVEFKRARGDVWEFKRVYNEVIENCEDLGRA